MIVSRSTFVIAILMCLCVHVSAATFIDYYSPRNAQRPKRRDTYFIVLHTTEGAARGSLNKVYENGEAHYFVDTDGKIYRVISRDRVAFHSGRSMWSGRTGIDDYSIGIEIVGYHDRSITAAQYTALRELVAATQKIYRIPDDKVLTHSMVAYGAPNRWHPRSHRGRKRCGMLFAKDSVRAKLGLTSKPAYDPDVRAGRLVDADPVLSRILYGREKVNVRAVADSSPKPDVQPDVISKSMSAWDIARDRYNSADTIYVYPDGRRIAGSQVKEWKSIPVGTRVAVGGACENEAEKVREIGGAGSFARDVAGDEYNKETTVYFLPDGSFKYGSQLTEGDFGGMSKGTRVLVGYVYGGKVTANKSAYDICGKRWNFPSTYYLLVDGSLQPGSDINEKQIPHNAHIFYQQ